MKRSLRLLCISDHIDSLVYSESLKERFGDVDAVISCGDLKRHYYEYIVTTLNKPFVYVLGNHSQFSIRGDSESGFDSSDGNGRRLFSGGILADGRCRYLRDLDLIIAGFGGSKRYSRGSNQYTEFEMLFRILRILPRLWFNRLFRGRYIDILVTHAPPRHINDLEDPCHQGFRVFRWFLRKFRPPFMVHGHIHLYCNTDKRITEYHDTRVINTYNHYILKTDSARRADERL